MARPFRPKTQDGARITGLALAWLIRGLGATWRLRVEGDDRFAREGPALGAAWHRDAVMAAWFFRDRRILVPVSLSREGHLFDRALRLLGYADSARGSSTRGATGLLRQLVRALRGGAPVAVLPDGPHGPPRRAKPGVVAVASTCGVPIIPVAFAARWAIANPNWDRTSIPLPFSRVVCKFGEPLAVPRRLDADGVAKALQELERRLDVLRVEVDELAGVPPDLPEREGR